MLTSHSCNASFIFSCLFLLVHSRVSAWTGLVSPVTAVWWWPGAGYSGGGTGGGTSGAAQSALVSGPVHIVTVATPPSVSDVCRGKMDAAVVTRQQGDT